MEKIKLFIEGEKGKDLMVVFIVILVGLGSFELGRLSKIDSNQGIKVEYPAKVPGLEANAIDAISGSNNSSYYPKKPTNTTRASNPAPKTTQNFFASSRGNKYYPVGCSAGKSIKTENRVYFGSSTEAENAGYTLSSSCK